MIATVNTEHWQISYICTISVHVGVWAHMVQRKMSTDEIHYRKPQLIEMIMFYS